MALKKTRYKARPKITITELRKKGRALLVALGNANDADIEKLRSRFAFLRNYSDEQILRSRDELRLIWQRKTSFEGVDHVSVVEPTDRASVLYEEIERNAGAVQQPPEQWICEHWLHSEKRTVLVDWQGAMKHLYPNPSSLPAQLAWALIHNVERLGYCGNPNCKHPRFLKKKQKQQIYCSRGCALPSERERKRIWWELNRGKKKKGFKHVN